MSLGMVTGKGIHNKSDTDLNGFLRKFSLFRMGRNASSSSIEEEKGPDSYAGDQWRTDTPVNPNDPLAIQRHMTRRVTFAGLLHTADNDDIPQNIDDYSSPTNKQTQNLIVTVHDDSPGSEDECHVNQIFQSDESKPNEYFVSAFGEKGKRMGDYQDAKDVTLLPRGRLLITDLVNSRIQLCNSTGRALMVYSGDDIREPWATAVTKENYIAVTSCKNRCVLILNADGDVIKTFGENVLVCPTGIAVDNEGQFIVCDSMADKVLLYDSNGQFVKYIGNPEIAEETFSKPRYVCVSITGEIIVSDSGNHKIKVFDSRGHFKRSFGGFGKERTLFKCPYGVSTNKLGDIFVADHYNNRICMFSRDGVFIREIVTAEQGLVHPQGVTISSDLHLYITHGHLKANEILIFKLSTAVNYESIDCISHV